MRVFTNGTNSTNGTNGADGIGTATSVGTLVNGLTEKTPPVDADMLGLMDSAASNIWKKLSWANVKATLKTYFDGIYQAAGSYLTALTPWSSDVNAAGHSLVGDTTSAGNLTLKSTSHATKGQIKFGSSYYTEGGDTGESLNLFNTVGSTPLNVTGTGNINSNNGISVKVDSADTSAFNTGLNIETYGGSQVTALEFLAHDATVCCAVYGYIFNATSYAYGLYLDFTRGGNGTAYGICVQGETKNFLSGRLGIGGSSPPPSVILQLTSTTAAFLPPRMTTTQKNAIASPSAGMFVFDTTLNKICVYTTSWETYVSGSYLTALTPWTSDVNAAGYKLVGNTTAGGNLLLLSTSHATKGQIQFGTSVYDEVKNALGLGTATPNANAILDVVSTTKAFLPPRMTTTQKNAIASPTAGMVVYDTTLNKLCTYTTMWETQQSGASPTGILVERWTPGSAASSHTFSGLNNLTDGEYILDWQIPVTGISGYAIDCYVNGDTTNGNYFQQYHEAWGGDNTAQGENNDPSIGYLQGYEAAGTFTIKVVNGYVWMRGQQVRRQDTSFNMCCGEFGVIYKITITSITSLTVSCSASNAFIAGSIFTLSKTMN
jgi:hypothetical protein